MFKHKNKNGYWYIHYKDINSNKWNKISTKKKSKVDAERFLLQFQNDYNKEKETGIKQILFKEFIEFYKSKRQNDITKTILSSYIYILKEFQKVNNINSLQDIKQAHIDNYKDYLNKIQNENSTIKGKMIKLMYCIKFAKSNKLLSKDIELKPLAVKLIEKERAYVNENNFKKICNNIVNQDFKDILIVTYYTGLRLNEIINLKKVNVNLANLDKGFITLDNQEFLTKNRKTRLIPVPPPAMKVLVNRCNIINNNDYVFTNNNKKWNNTNLRNKFVKFTKKIFDSNINYTFHSLRHGYASMLASKNVNILVIKELLGHQDIKTTQRYIHIPNDLIKDSINNLNF
jgi:integrase